MQAPPSIPSELNSLLATLGVSNEDRIGTTSSSPFTGSPEFDGAPFHVDIGRQPRLNTFVLIQSDKPEVVHYGRIIEGQEENPRAEPGRLQQNQAYRVGQKSPRPSDQAPHVTRVMNAEILGQLSIVNEALEISEPEVLPQTGMSVYELPVTSISDLLNAPKEMEEGLFLGHVKSGEQKAEFLLPMSALPRHIAILGKTGVGKSYFAGVMVEEITRQAIPTISIDILGDLQEATEHLGGVNLKAGDNFKIPYSIVGRREFLAFIPTLSSGGQEEIVADAYDAIYMQAIAQLNQYGKVDISKEELLEEIKRVAEANGQKAVGSRAIKKVEFALNRKGLLTDTLGNWVDELITKPLVNIYVGHLGQSARNLIVGAAGRVLQSLRKRNAIPPFTFFLDEAHFFLPSGESTPSTQVMRELIRTARHDAVSIILITQSPSSLDKQTLMVCNTRVVFALDPDDLKVVAGTMGDLPQPVIDRLSKMAKGRAIVSSAQDILRHPALVHIRPRTTPEGAPTPNLKEAVQAWHQTHTL